MWGRVVRSVADETNPSLYSLVFFFQEAKFTLSIDVPGLLTTLGLSFPISFPTIPFLYVRYYFLCVQALLRDRPEDRFLDEQLLVNRRSGRRG